MASVKDLSFFGVETSRARLISEADFDFLVRQGCRPEVGDVLIAKDGNSALDTVCVQREPAEFVLLSSVAIIRPDKTQLVPDFLSYIFRNPPYIDYLKANFISGAAIPRVVLRDFKRAIIELPPLPEQRAIAATLGALDDKIALNRRMNETLEAMARALFRDWFVDFGPTRAKMAGQAPYLSPALWDLFPASLDDEGKPEGWVKCTLGDVAALNPESWTARNAPAKVRYVDLSNTKWGNIDQVEHYAWDEAPSRARRILRIGDTIVGTVRPGNGSFAYVGVDDLTGSTGFAVLRPNNVRDRTFVWCAATSSENIERLTHLADGGAYPAVQSEVVAATGIVLAPSDVLEAFSLAANELLILAEKNKQETRTLAQTRDLLLPRLISGELRVSEAEVVLEKTS